MRNTIHMFATEDLRLDARRCWPSAHGPAMRRFEQLGLDEAAVERTSTCCGSELAGGRCREPRRASS